MMTNFIKKKESFYAGTTINGVYSEGYVYYQYTDESGFSWYWMPGVGTIIETKLDKIYA